jgi:hypothetical protein
MARRLERRMLAATEEVPHDQQRFRTDGDRFVVSGRTRRSAQLVGSACRQMYRRRAESTCA